MTNIYLPHVEKWKLLNLGFCSKISSSPSLYKWGCSYFPMPAGSIISEHTELLLPPFVSTLHILLLLFLASNSRIHSWSSAFCYDGNRGKRKKNDYSVNSAFLIPYHMVWLNVLEVVTKIRKTAEQYWQRVIIQDIIKFVCVSQL